MAPKLTIRLTKRKPKAPASTRIFEPNGARFPLVPKLQDCVAIEDTDAGVAAAHRAGMGFIVAAPTLLTRGQGFISRGASLVVSDLSILYSGEFPKLAARCTGNANSE